MISPLHQTALNQPNVIAIKQASSSVGSLTYQQLSAMVCHLVKTLQTQGIKQHSRLACVSKNNLEMVCLYWACVDLGAVLLPISPRFPAQQINQLCQRFNIDAIWLEPSFMDESSIKHNNKADNNRVVNKQQLTISLSNAALGGAIPKINPQQPLNIILTSGSSGAPKAVVHCLENHIASAVGSANNIALAQGDSWLLSLPLFHIGGLAIINRCALAGAAVVLNDSQALWQQIIESKVTHVSLVAAQLSKLLAQHPHALDSVKALLLGGGAIEPHLVSALADKQVNAYCSYGMSEMSSQITTAAINPQGHLGQVLLHRQLNIVDNTIWVKGDCLFLGYLADSDKNESSHAAITQASLTLPLDSQGWFNTQDRAKQDEKGNLYLLGRTDNMFICGGENIHPEEIEAALKSHPLVNDAVVFAQADPQFSLLPAAIIQLTDKHSSLTAKVIESLQQHVLAKVARFKRPRQYYSWPENVITTSLKVPRKAIIAAVKANLNEVNN
ncbi:o-succinylbenzoate--CoA ligase [Shewanella sp. 10N.286.52.A9]|uniref:o-succinylbenzoate--CoA ligase n=1 Tax=Shewanella sp. 10N.286.52.A9 TaxID=3229711 RepID=UPI00354D2B4C